ncbi:hypothetical protein LZC95_46785 [Pendulispora brunnea]|uniref:Aminoglycoside phosphotransferase domain-containing protein n=1 Tax=Pendulispora brunnea TaxID=2905690 RepID=A0ABZ2K5H1_9BACT
MLVFSDAERVADTRRALHALRAKWRGLARAGRLPWASRHARLVALFVDVSELLQAIVDHEFQRTRIDRPSPTALAAAHALTALARALRASWHGRVECPDPHALDAFFEMPIPERARLRAMEGYTHYAVYPEMYVLAAEQARAAASEWCVVGIRSIGLSLGACVAAGLDAPAPFSVRPIGPPFQRALAIGPALEARLLQGPEAAYAIVDEGPGLSGSSFGCVADWLEARKVAPERIHFFPSHRGDVGARGSEAHRARWKRSARHVIDFEDVFLHGPAKDARLEQMFVDHLGPPEGPCEDLGAGAWRAHRFAHERDWPACLPHRERRKYRVRAAGTSWLLRFAGLGRYGEEMMARARRLAAEGLVPPVLAYRHGFIAEEWLGDHIPLSVADVPRADVVEAVVRHLTFLARERAQGAAMGAMPLRLLEMLEHNIRSALGQEMARHARQRWEGALREVVACHEPILGDNKMHAWEWLVAPNGRILKTDALDHHAAHDLIGAQDIGWDMAGARIELGLSNADHESLVRAVALRTGYRRTHTQLAFYQLAYAAFQLGLHTMQRDALEAGHPEIPRLQAACTRYAQIIGRLLYA